MKTEKVLFILYTQYTNEDNHPTLRGIFTSKKLRREAINEDKKRIRREGNLPYKDDYILEERLINNNVLREIGVMK